MADEERETAEEETRPPPAPGPAATEEEEEDERDPGRTAPFGWVSLLVIVALVVGTWFLIQTLSADTKMQDCIQSGRRNCAPIEDTRP